MTDAATLALGDVPDLAALGSYLATIFPGIEVPPCVERIDGGQSNPTFFVTAGPHDLVLRCRPRGIGPSSAHDVAREYRALTALSTGPVPVPEPVALERGDAVLGSAFYLMRRLHGTVYADSRLPGLDAESVRAIYRSMATTLGALHTVDWHRAGLADMQRPGSYIDRQIKRWSAVWADDPQVIALDHWLRDHHPGDASPCIIHGDFRLGNVIVAGDRIAGVLDWELFTIGDPLADLAHTLVGLWYTTGPEYGGVMGDEDRPGLPTMNLFVEWYSEATGTVAPLDRFHVVLALFRNAGIFQGIANRKAAGTAASPRAAEVGRMGRVYLARAHALAFGRSPA